MVVSEHLAIMPPHMALIYQECASARGWQEVEVPSSTPGKMYKVLLPPWDREYEESIICECSGYEYRGRCRHQREAYNYVCQWNELDSSPQSKDERIRGMCPECGGKTHIVVENDNG